MCILRSSKFYALSIPDISTMKLCEISVLPILLKLQAMVRCAAKVEKALGKPVLEVKSQSDRGITLELIGESLSWIPDKWRIRYFQHYPAW